jgi:hypothetical protein
MESDEGSTSRDASDGLNDATGDRLADISSLAAAQVAQGPQISPEADSAILQLQVRSCTSFRVGFFGTELACASGMRGKLAEYCSFSPKE